MKYYVMADIHGFYTEMITALDNVGYFTDVEPHKIIVCGDIFDRGKEAKKIQDFVVDLLAKDEIILIRGNHEDLAMDMLNRWHRISYCEGHHISNGTTDTMLQLLDLPSKYHVLEKSNENYRAFANTSFISKIIPEMVDYYETEHYLFVHGWIPHKDWRNASKEEWTKSRWVNGMECHHDGIKDDKKTIICGHWHTSFGHSMYENKGGEFDNNPDFSPYYADGIIALDGCTAYSRKVNCIVIED